MYYQIKQTETKKVLLWQFKKVNTYKFNDYKKAIEFAVHEQIKNIDCINRKAQWVSKWLNGNQNLLTRLIGFGLVEGLFFAGSFCSIY